MAAVRKILGQATPGAVLTDLYTTPSATDTVVSSIVVANVTTNQRTFRIAIRQAGAAIANKHYLAYDKAIQANDTITFVLGITLAATDVISVYGSDSSVAFSAFGQENT